MARQLDLASYVWYGPSDDIVQVISMPDFMISQAVTQVKAVAEKQKKTDKIVLILGILGIVFEFLFIDDIGPELEFLDGIGNIGLSIQAMISEPASAPLEILGLLTAGSGMAEDDYANLADARREIGTDDLSKIGAAFEDADSDSQSIFSLPCTL